jgi:hypothetical protein
MSETPPGIWKRPIRGAAWFVLLAAGIFVIVCIIALSARSWQWLLLGAVASILLAALACGAFLFARWLCSWQNFRRFLFGVACVVTLVALAYAEENWRGRHAWQRHRAQWEAKGEKFDIPALAPPMVPDEKNFALTPLLKPALDFTQGPTGVVWHDTNGVARLEKVSAYLEPDRKTNNQVVLGSLEKGTFADLTECAQFYRGNSNYPQSGTTASPAETILVALAKLNPELTELREAASNRPCSRFPIHYDSEPTWGILLPHLVRIKALAMLASVRATAELDAGRFAEAFADLQLGFRLADSIKDEPLLIDHLVRIAALTIDLQTLREGLVRHAWTDADLAQLETYLGSIDLLAEFKLGMRGERACSIGGLDYIRRQGWFADPMMYLGDDNGSAACTPAFSAMPRGWYYQNMLTISRMFQDFTLPSVDERAHRVFPQTSENGMRAVLNLRTSPYTIFAKMLLPPLERAVHKSARAQTYVDCARVACALERSRLANGKFPEALADLTPRFIDRVPEDVIDGKPLRYRRDPDGGYVLYSVGWNQTDEGGELAWTKKDTKPSEIDITRGDWVWQMPAGLSSASLAHARTH